MVLTTQENQRAFRHTQLNIPEVVVFQKALHQEVLTILQATQASLRAFLLTQLNILEVVAFPKALHQAVLIILQATQTSLRVSRHIQPTI